MNSPEQPTKSEERSGGDAALAIQAEFWDRWNQESRSGNLNPYMERLREVAVGWARRAVPSPRILEIGCGTGWMSEGLSSVGQVVGVDLSTAAIDTARRRCQEATFLQGDFFELDLEVPFDVVVTADTIAHVRDQQRFVDRVAELLVTGGLFVLMSQNAVACTRSSWVRPLEPGQLRHWPSASEFRAMLSRDFSIERITSAVPLRSDRGIFRVLNAPRVWAALCRVLSTKRASALYESLRLGGELVVIAKRR